MLILIFDEHPLIGIDRLNLAHSVQSKIPQRRKRMDAVRNRFHQQSDYPLQTDHQTTILAPILIQIRTNQTRNIRQTTAKTIRIQNRQRKA